MSAGSQNTMTCGQVEPLLAEAAEGTLASAEMRQVREHTASCAVCGPLLAEAERGRAWLGQLAELEPPAKLMHNILAATSHADPAMRRAPQRTAKGWRESSLRTLRGFKLWLGPMTQPRLAGTFAMAFFSIALLLNIMGVHITDIRNVDLRPHAIRLALSHTYYSTSARVAKYYDSMRLVYEVQTRLQDLRNALPEQQQQPEPKKEQKNDKKDHSNYQHSEPESAPAYARAGSTVVASLTFECESALQFSSLLSRCLNRTAHSLTARLSKKGSREDDPTRRAA